MKRAGNLFDRICEPENLREAFVKALRGKAERKDARAFVARLDENLLWLRAGLLEGSVPVGAYRYFTIRDPKERTICAAAFSERVLHHAIMNVCDPVFERYQIFDSYATRLGKGTFAALERAERFAERDGWFVKLDARKYFDSINHSVLREMLARLFNERRLLDLFDRIIASYEAAAGRGVPIGNLTSQYFANHYLATADHFVKEELGVRRYVRYMDDMVLWGRSREEVLESGQSLKGFLRERLALATKPECLNRVAAGVPFLGFRVFPGQTLLRPASRRRFRRKMARLWGDFESGEIGEKEFGKRAETLSAHIAHAGTKGFRRSVLRNLGHRPGARTA